MDGRTHSSYHRLPGLQDRDSLGLVLHLDTRRQRHQCHRSIPVHVGRTRAQTEDTVDQSQQSIPVSPRLYLHWDPAAKDRSGRDTTRWTQVSS